MAWTLRYDLGTLVLHGADAEELPDGFVWDSRFGFARGPGHLYGRIVERCRAAGTELVDEARAYNKLPTLRHLSSRTPREYQKDAVAAWRAGRWRGIVVLPTGAGKSFVAETCIALAQRQVERRLAQAAASAPFTVGGAARAWDGSARVAFA